LAAELSLLVEGNLASADISVLIEAS